MARLTLALLAPAAVGAFLVPHLPHHQSASLSRSRGLVHASGSAELVDNNRVVLRDSATGHEATVWLHGGCVTSYKAPHEVLAVRKDAAFDGSKPIAGGLQICWPQFGAGAIQQHGFARNLPWVLESKSSSSAEATLALRPSEATRKIWDKDFELLLAVKLNPKDLHVRLTVKNTGAEAWDFTSALHSYYGVSSVSRASINGAGLDGAEFVDKTKSPPESRVVKGSFHVDSFLEGVLPNLPGPLSLFDAGTGASVSVEHAGGWKDYVLWNPHGNDAMGYDKFVCVESGVVSSPVKVDAKSQWVGDLKIVPSH